MANFLYLYFWFIFIIGILVFLLIKFAINFFKLNGISPLLMIFDKQNRLLLILLLSFTIIFWISFYGILKSKYWPYIDIEEDVIDINTDSVNKIYNTTNCFVGLNCKRINKINVMSSKDITLEITEHKKDYIKFKLNSNVFVNRCKNCNLVTIDADKEYKMTVNEVIEFDIIDKNNNLKYNYIISLN